MASQRERLLVGIFETAGDARRAIEDLRAANFSDRDVGILTHRRRNPDVKSFRELEGNRAGTGAAVGVGVGAGGGALWRSQSPQGSCPRSVR